MLTHPRMREIVQATVRQAAESRLDRRITGGLGAGARAGSGRHEARAPQPRSDHHRREPPRQISTEGGSSLRRLAVLPGGEASRPKALAVPVRVRPHLASVLTFPSIHGPTPVPITSRGRFRTGAPGTERPGRSNGGKRPRRPLYRPPTERAPFHAPRPRVPTRRRSLFAAPPAKRRRASSDDQRRQ
jgi:hypothetical protein